MTAASNRIPLRVNHDEFGGETFRSGGIDSSTFDMRNMNDETDRIKSRMREFEDRCRKWREEFFSRQSNGIQGGDSSFEQRVPFSSPKFSSSIPADDASFFSSSPSRSSKPTFASSLHKSSVEDTPEGGKKYKMEFEIGDFKPNELHLSTHGRTLIVKGDRELKAGSATETKTFNRELTVPDYVDIERMSAALLDNMPASGSSNNVLIIEAPIIMDKYSYRRSAFDNQSASPIRTSRQFSSNMGQHRSTSPPGGLNGVGVSIHAGATGPSNNHQTSSSKTTTFNPATGTTTTSESSHQEKRTSTTSTSQTTKIIRSSGSDGDFTEHVVISKPMTSSPSAGGFDDVRFGGRGLRGVSSNLSYNQSIAPELING